MKSSGITAREEHQFSLTMPVKLYLFFSVILSSLISDSVQESIDIQLKWRNINFSFNHLPQLDFLKGKKEHLRKRCINFTISSSVPFKSSEEIYNQIYNSSNSTEFFPFYSSHRYGDDNNFSFMPLTQFRHPIVISRRTKPLSLSSAIWQTMFETWPLFVICLLCAGISGIIVWALVSDSFIMTYSG